MHSDRNCPGSVAMVGDHGLIVRIRCSQSPVLQSGKHIQYRRVSDIQSSIMGNTHGSSTASDPIHRELNLVAWVRRSRFRCNRETGCRSKRFPIITVQIDTALSPPGGETDVTVPTLVRIVGKTCATDKARSVDPDHQSATVINPRCLVVPHLPAVHQELIGYTEISASSITPGSVPYQV